MRRRFALLLVLIVAAAGCTRGYYRRQADREVYDTVAEARRPDWPLCDYTIQPKCESRMYDPNDPDRPPLPPDDPAAHALMHCVDGKKGWEHWHRNGDTPFVENPCWRRYLPWNEEGVVLLDREAAVHLALIHSREYQQEMEDLYLSALDVTFQRYRFDVQFFGGTGIAYTSQGHLHRTAGGESRSTLEINNDLRAERLFATGGELVVNAANSLVWQFSGPDQYSAGTILDFNLLQPLLRYGGRAYVLEQLTDAERALLSNIRQTERYRQAFFVQVFNGRNVGPGPARGGNLLANFAPVTTAAAAGASGGVVASGGGILGLLTDQQVIRNQRANVASLRDALAQLQSVYEAGRIDRFQVELARQALFNAQSRLLGLEKTHQDRLDAYKIAIGLPPDLPMQVRDSMLSRFSMIEPELTAVIERLAGFLDDLRAAPGGAAVAPAQPGERLAELRARVDERLASVRQDLAILAEALPGRRESLRRLAEREEAKRRDVEPSLLDVAVLDSRAERLAADFQKLEAAVQASLADADRLVTVPAAEQRTALLEWGTRLSELLSTLSLVQAQARLDSQLLVPIELDPAEALEVARAHRLDWMNARAALVDIWRQIEIRANELQSDLNLQVSGDLGTTDNNPLRFTSTTGRLRMGLRFDAPLSRLAERNIYREALLEYQRARRAYYAVEDRVQQSLRNTLRTIRLDQMNFEIRRAAITLAIMQVEMTRYRLQRPPPPGAATAVSPTLARDLVQSLAELLNSQNDLLNVWVDYESQRMNLDLDLGTMRLDARGMWVDPGTIGSGFAPTAGVEEVPPPEAALNQGP